MDPNPVLLVIGLDESNTSGICDQIILSFAKCEEGSNTRQNDGTTLVVNNNYYSCKFDLHKACNENIIQDHILRHVEAVLLYIDHDIANGISYIDRIASRLNHCQADTKMLVFKDELTNDIETRGAQKWCSRNGYELIKLQNPAYEGEEDDGFQEKFGIDRVIEVIHTHEWSNLIMKRSSKPVKIDNSMDMTDGIQKTENNIEPSVAASNNNTGETNNTDDKANYEKLSTLFESFHTVKTQASSLNHPERLKLAEKYATDFMEAMGVDDESSNEE